MTDGHGELLDQTVADLVRAALVYPAGSIEGAEAMGAALRFVTEQYGAPALRDLSIALADVAAELFEVVGRHEGREPLAVLDEWGHDVPPCEV